MMEKVNMSPVIMENIIVTNGPVSLIALQWDVDIVTVMMMNTMRLTPQRT